MSAERFPLKRHWPYEWRVNGVSASGHAETEDAITAEEFERLLFKWNAAGQGHWTFRPLAFDRDAKPILGNGFHEGRPLL